MLCAASRIVSQTRHPGMSALSSISTIIEIFMRHMRRGDLSVNVLESWPPNFVNCISLNQ